jgi:hypothetical protein
LVGGSNPSRGANLQKIPMTLKVLPGSLAAVRTADIDKPGSTTPRSGGDRP